MRFLSGFIFGCLITIGVAYVHDVVEPTDPPGDHRRLVNWDVVGADFAVIANNTRAAWDRLVDKRDDR